jgi:predicted GH43/DUF377 family glycosyl hydrolase
MPRRKKVKEKVEEKKKVEKVVRRRGRPRKVKVTEEIKPEVKVVYPARKIATLSRFEGNPIISPNPQNDWESWQTFNAGAIVLDDKVHLLYRAIGSDGISRFGYASSRDGFRIDERLARPAYEHPLTNNNTSFEIHSYVSGGSWGGAEDPRITRVENEDRLYVTYTACNGGLRVALTSIKVEDFLNKRWDWKKPVMISPPGEINKNWVIFPKKIHGKYAILHSITPKILISYFDTLDFDGKTFISSDFDSRLLSETSPEKRRYKKEHPLIWMKGAGPPPIETKHGWLIFFHTIDNGKYAVRAMVTELKNPEKIVCVSKAPVLKPTYPYENQGFKPGIVYTSGAVVKDNKLMIYYGASDNYVCVATAPFDEFVEDLISGKI